MKCSIHPTYVGKGKPRSKHAKCTCPTIYRSAQRKRMQTRIASIPSKPRVTWTAPPPVESLQEAVNEAPLNAEQDELEELSVDVDLPTQEPAAIPRYPASNGTFSTGRPRPAINTEPLVESADSLIEAALAQKHPELHVVRAPEGYRLRGASTLIDGEGNVVQQWVKTTKVQDDPDHLVRIAKSALLANPVPQAPDVVKIAETSDAYEVAIVIGDPHFGMLAWAKETGDDWDVDIARRVHINAIREALRISPPSSRLLLINLGDAVHSDGNNAQTTAGTRVDVDSRWSKVVGIFVETMNVAISEGLQKHDHVELVTNRGNHDDLTSMVIQMVLAERWRENPRVTIAPNLQMVWYHQFGSNLLASTHGHKTRMAQLPALIAQDARVKWGATKRTHVYCGHVHHHKAQEFPGVEVEYFNTLASKDSWHAQEGYRSKRSLRCDVWHRDRGLTAKYELNVEQFL